MVAEFVKLIVFLGFIVVGVLSIKIIVWTINEVDSARNYERNGRD